MLFSLEYVKLQINAVLYSVYSTVKYYFALVCVVFVSYAVHMQC